MSGVEAEIAAAVVVVDPGRGVHHAGPEARPVRLDQADGVAVPIDDRQEDRAAPGGLAAAIGSAARCGSMAASAASRAVEELRHRDVVRLGVGQVAVAVRQRELRRLEAEVDPIRVDDASTTECRGGWRVEPLEDPEDLQRDDPGAVGRMGRRPDAAVVDGDRLAQVDVWSRRSSIVSAQPAAASARACCSPRSPS